MPECIWERGPTSPTLAKEDVHVWCGSLDQPAPDVHRFGHVLSSAEQTRAGRFHFERHRRRYIISQGQLRIILGRYLGIPPGDVQFRQGPRGKPELAETPGAGPLRFNMSHSNELALFAVARGRSVGIDIESLRPMPDAERIVGRYFAEREIEDFQNLAPSERLEGFFNCWTRKEAYLKATGEGLYLPLAGFAVTLAPGVPAHLLHVEGGAQEAERWSMQELCPAPGYVAAIAVEGGWRNLECWQWLE